MKTAAQLRTELPVPRTIAQLDIDAALRAVDQRLTRDEARRQIAVAQGFKTWAAMVESRHA